ncbi:hypothetical protein [Nocardia testacea]|uniref:Uncharacterized protein n=1 Tax=Nocardia testacea TaxID=248551 RepID=A0ABW7W266_9NOCA
MIDSATTGNFGAVLIDWDSYDFPVFRPLDRFDEAEHLRYMAAHDLIESYLSKSMIIFVREESLRLVNYLHGIGTAMQRDGRVAPTDADGLNIRDAIAAHVLAVANAYFVYREQRREQAKQLSEQRDDDTWDQVKIHLDALYEGCAAYRWLVESRNALVHLDLMGTVLLRLSIATSREPMIELRLARRTILQTRNMNQRNMAAYREELESLSDDPAVLDLLKEVLPVIAETDKQVRKAMYPANVLGDAATTVRELIGRFHGQEGTYCLQTGPGFTEEHRIPQHIRLSVEVLEFARTYPH